MSRKKRRKRDYSDNRIQDVVSSEASELIGDAKDQADETNPEEIPAQMEAETEVLAEESDEVLMEESAEDTVEESGEESAEELPEENAVEVPARIQEEYSEGTGFHDAAYEVEIPVRKKWSTLKKLNAFLISFGAVIIIALCVYEYNLVYKLAQVEAGINVEVGDFLRYPDANAYFTAESDEFDTAVPGTYKLKIMTGGLAHSATLVVQDTIKPEISVKKLTANYNEPVGAEEFVTDIKDATEVTVEYVKEPDFTKLGDQDVELVATDLGNNSVKIKSVINITPIRTELMLEAGSPVPKAEDFVLSGNKAELNTDLESVDMNKLGSTDVVISMDGRTYNSRLTIVDTVAPSLLVDKIEGYTNAHYEAEDFVLRSIDKTEVKFSYETEPDFTLLGTQDVTIIATDEGGNVCEKTTTLTLAEDTEDPVIEGAVDLEAYVGDSVAYKQGVTVVDNCMKDLRLEVDTSKVNLNEEGTYPLVYTAYDASGRSSSAVVSINVKKHEYDVDIVNALVDEALSKCTNPSMSKREICESIYNYLHNTVAYVSDSEKGDPVRSAYEGLALKKGDCYVFFSTAKLMLTRAGINNFDIERIPEGTKLHYWNIVDIEDGHGWYHFDTTPRKGRPYLCLLDDATITAYSMAHDNCHNYDRTKYPAIP